MNLHHTPHAEPVTPAEAARVVTGIDAVGSIGASAAPALTIDLRGVPRLDAGRLDALVAHLHGAPWVTIGWVDAQLNPRLAGLADTCDVLLGEATGLATVVDVADLADDTGRLLDAIAASPMAAVNLVQLLRLSAESPIGLALHAESITYGLLQTGARFQSWLAGRPQRPPTAVGGARRIELERHDSLLHIRLDRPERRNALDTAMRDQLAEALELLATDRSLDGAILEGRGSNFCAGGDLDEFGSTPSPAIGHRVRTLRSLPRLMHRVGNRLRVHVHGPCVGAGIELPAFAHHIIAHPEASFRLPELGYGLVPGAGGTVSITRRCGRQRTAWLALTGTTIDAATARAWHLVDRIDTSVFT